MFFFFKQKTAYEMRISDWSSDVCSSDLPGQTGRFAPTGLAGDTVPFTVRQITSVTSSVDGQNRFRVADELAGDRHAGLRPGMESCAQGPITRASNFWVWTRGPRHRPLPFSWNWLTWV